jgi:hypothetical protein
MRQFRSSSEYPKPAQPIAKPFTRMNGFAAGGRV